MTDHVPVGWVCPQCGRVWAPVVVACGDCNRIAELILRDSGPDKPQMAQMGADGATDAPAARTDKLIADS